MASDSSAVLRAIEAVCRIESSRVIARIARLVRDVGLAEELAQDAFVTALEQWPEAGIPDNPGAWLTAVAKRRAVDHIRRERNFASKEESIGYETESSRPDFESDFDPDLEEESIADDLLRLIFTSCHPVLSAEARAALTLRVLGGLTTREIARAFLVPEATMAQRIVRAKRSLTEARVPFEVPRGADRESRLASVLEVLYLIFNEGYVATSGERWLRQELCEEALRLGRILAELVPLEPEVHGLVALMEIQASRGRARVGSDGKPVLLLEQDRAKWDRLLIGRGLTALERAEKLGRGLGPYGMQAAIAACHARALRPEDTDWIRIAALYDGLVRMKPSPIVELNRAVAVSMAYGPEAGLELVEGLVRDGELEDYPALHAAHGDLLAKTGRWAEARQAFERAAALSMNGPERDLLLDRARACSQGALWWKAMGKSGTV